MNEIMDNPVKHELREELAQCDAAIAGFAPVLKHLLLYEDSAAFSERVVAQSRGMLADIAHQLFNRSEFFNNNNSRIKSFSQEKDELAECLWQDSDLLTHVHGLAIEWQLADYLESNVGLDVALSPLLQELVGSGRPELAEMAMSVLAAQARASQQAMRMELPVEELPAELFDRVLTLFERAQSGTERAQKALEEGQNRRKAYDERRIRLNQIARLLVMLGPRLEEALSIDHAGVAIFATALAAASGQDRHLMLYSFSENQAARLALSMRAAGFRRKVMERQFALLHPDWTMPPAFADISSDAARELLAASPFGTSG
ncbi:hypothetical protein D6851_02050 [Altericroceibacterium spongiae]|uniref:Uncharacterized protein n=1 Tax=Altericroceibacterium spongiae TaxID=2320269 RepID=A0A420ERH1_9SPHN|nr:hypothetical protein [Altericroceibacterium spongiae]RKF23282.1 hypothetical protein D6851_02050 [Altericroceibacterium spongiae]